MGLEPKESTKKKLIENGADYIGSAVQLLAQQSVEPSQGRQVLL